MAMHEEFLSDKGSNITFELARFHTGFEKLAHDDSMSAREHVWQHLQQANRHVQAILQSGESMQSGSLLMADAQLRDAAEQTQARIAELGQAATARLQDDRTLVADSAVEQRLDEIFLSALEAAQALEAGSRHSVSKQFSHYRSLSNGLGALLFVFAFVIAVRVFYYARNRQETLRSLRQSEKSLRQSEQGLLSLVETMSDWVWEVDSNGTYTYASANVANLLGYRADEIIGRTAYAVMPEDEAKNATELFAKKAHARQPFARVEITRLHKNGRKLVCEISAIPVYGADGKYLGYLGIDRDLTKRKYAEAALRTSESRLAEAQRIARIGNWDWNIETDDLYWSDEIYRIFGLIPQKVAATYAAFLESIHPDDRNELERSVHAALDKKLPYGIDYRILLPDGELRTVHEEGEVTFDDSGKAIRMFGTTQDITDRKRAAEELRGYRDRLEDLVAERTAVVKQQAKIIDQIHDAVVSMDPDGRVTSWNRGAERLFGYPMREAMQQVISFLYPDEAKYNFKDRLASLLENRNNYEFEERMRRKDGEVFYAHASLSLRYDGDGNLTGIIGYYLDITKRKRAEEALRASERRYRAVVEDQTELICRFESDGTLSFVNDAYCRYFGKTHDELIGQGFMPLIPQEDRALATKNIQSLSAERPVASVEHRVVLPDGTIRWHRWTDRAIFDHKHTLIEYQAVGHDITERKQAEAQLRTQTVELAAINRELESFSYSVSHDLRAPLRSIGGFSQALLEDYADRLDETGADYLRRVCVASLRMSELIDDLLMLCKVTRREMRYELVDLSAMAIEVAAELERSDSERSVDFSIEKGLWVSCDRQLLRIVVDNLLGNAFKYTAREDCARIELGTMQHNGRRIFFVRDNGVGFDCQYIHKLFQPFQRLHGNEEFEGTGIGLATVARIIQRHHGTVWAEADVNQGATFYFSLPEDEA